MASVREILKRLASTSDSESGQAPRADAAPIDVPSLRQGAGDASTIEALASKVEELSEATSLSSQHESSEAMCRDPWHQMHNGTEYSFFFLCGHPRSGTHWMQALLNLHPRINIQGEYHFEMLFTGFWQFESRDWHLGAHEPMRSIAKSGIQRIVRECMLSTTHLRPGATVLGDMTPRELFVMLPGAPTIHIVRDPRDVIVSWTFHQLRIENELASRGPWQVPMAALLEKFKEDPAYFERNPDLLLSVEPWVRHVARNWAERARRDAAAKARITGGIAKGTVHEVRYEEIHADPETERRKMYQFLGLDPDEALPLDANPAAVAGFGGQGATSFYRSGKSGDWRTYFNDRAKQWFKEEAGERLIEVGYEQDGGW